jgi:hypothetical protein
MTISKEVDIPKQVVRTININSAPRLIFLASWEIHRPRRRQHQRQGEDYLYGKHRLLQEARIVVSWTRPTPNRVDEIQQGAVMHILNWLFSEFWFCLCKVWVSN